jgi:pantothenate kinase
MEDPAVGLKEEDLARALLLMVTNNIGQVAYLNAQLHKTPRIYFVGNFLRQNKISQKRLSYAINYWSKGEMEALFLEHEGYFGALGAFLLSQGVPHNLRKASNDGEKTGSDPQHRRRHTAHTVVPPL